MNTKDKLSTAEQLAKNIEETIKEIFPNSYASCEFAPSYPWIFITFALGKDETEFPNRYLSNDPAHHVFHIKNGLTEEGDIKDDMYLTLSTGGNFSTYPPAGSFNAMGRHKIPFRRVKGNTHKIQEGVKKYFQKTYKAFEE